MRNLTDGKYFELQRYTSHVRLGSTNMNRELFPAILPNDSNFAKANHFEENCTSKSTVYKHVIEEPSTTKMIKSVTLNASRSSISNRKVCSNKSREERNMTVTLNVVEMNEKAMTTDQKRVLNAKRRQSGRGKGI